MPIRLCLSKGCAQPATYRGRCQSHAKARETETHPNKQLYNGKRWQLLRRRVLFNQPLCGCGAIATDVDHVIPIEQGGLPYTISNLQPMCRPCHATKTNREVRDR